MIVMISRLYLSAMNILAIETSSAQGTIALQTDNTVEQIELGQPRQQIEQILPSINQLLTQQEITIAELDLLSFSAGPGSFTGVRVALGVIQGLALATGTLIAPVSSLQVLAQTAWHIYGFQRVFCCVNAYMQEVYCAAYQLDKNNLMCPVIIDQILTPAAVKELSLENYHGIGDAWQIYTEQLNEIIGIMDKTLVFPDADNLLKLANDVFQQGKAKNIEAVLPQYLRGKQAWQKTG